ncbi:hypothetical protein D3C71_1645300 [compost metagenome]
MRPNRRHHNQVAEGPRSATLTIPLGLVARKGCREVDRGVITGMRSSTVPGQSIVAGVASGRIYYVETLGLEALGLTTGVRIKIVEYESTYYLIAISETRKGFTHVAV